MMIFPKFDADRIVFSFGVLSDFHIKDEPDQPNQAKLLSALTQLQTAASADDPRGLALLAAAGDLTHDGREEEILTLRRTLEQAIDLRRIPFLYVAGNHDRHNPDCNAVYRRVFGDLTDPRFDAQDAAPEGILSGCRHVTVSGRHFITMDLPGKYHKHEPNTFSVPSRRWLDETLAAITAAEPGAYVFIITHQPIWDTCCGTTRGYFYATDDLTPILEKYPQVVTFGGHLHFPLNDERAIMQKAFTCIETATLSDMLIDGFDCVNVQGTKVEGRRDFAQGLLVQIDAGGNLRVKRMDFRRQAEIGDPWLLDAPTADGAHLRRYTAARGVEAPAIALNGGIAAELQAGEAGTDTVLRFPAARTGGWVRAYRVTLESSAGRREELHLTDFYRYPNPADVPREASVTLRGLAPGSYAVTVAAQDCWGNSSAPICGGFTVS